jgi:predicted kinase
MKSKIILISGYCATGKSTFAQKLSQALSVPCFRKDALKETLGDSFGENNGDVLEKGSSATFMLMLHIAEQCLKVGNVCILESNFKKSESEQLVRLLDKYDSECLTFLFKGDFDVIYDRYMNRDKNGERHWVHSIGGENRETFENGHIEAGLGDVTIGRTIVVNATDFIEVDYDYLFDSAKKFTYYYSE